MRECTYATVPKSPRERSESVAGPARQFYFFVVIEERGFHNKMWGLGWMCAVGFSLLFF